MLRVARISGDTIHYAFTGLTRFNLDSVMGLASQRWSEHPHFQTSNFEYFEFIMIPLPDQSSGLRTPSPGCFITCV